jgi:hypothetical protein
VFRQFFKAQTVRVTPKQLFQTVAPGAAAAFEFDVTNLSPAAMSYVLYRNSASGYPVSGPTSLSLAAGETKTVTLTVTVSPFAAAGTEDPLSLVVTSTGPRRHEQRRRLHARRIEQSAARRLGRHAVEGSPVPAERHVRGNRHRERGRP